MKLSCEKNKCFKRYFNNVYVRRQVNIKFEKFSNKKKDFIFTCLLTYSPFVKSW